MKSTKFNENKCYICKDYIGFEDHEYLKTRPFRYKKFTVKSDKLYFHRKCLCKK